MGYTTEFKGILKFTTELTTKQLRTLNTILGKDARDEIPIDGKPFLPTSGDFYYIDLEITPEFEGIRWNGAEKSYGTVEQVQFVLDYMRSKYPDFGLAGEMSAQGEDAEDRWKLVMQDGKPVKINTPPKGRKVTCPSCGDEFFLED